MGIVFFQESRKSSYSILKAERLGQFQTANGFRGMLHRYFGESLKNRYEKNSSLWKKSMDSTQLLHESAVGTSK